MTLSLSLFLSLRVENFLLHTNAHAFFFVELNCQSKWNAALSLFYAKCLFFFQDENGEITLYMKGADVVMQNHVNYNDWLEEEVILLYC